MAMATRAPFLGKAYSAYHHRERPAEDEELSRVGPGTPCGEYLRRFWQPVVLSEDLRDLPRRLRILGEDLVAFRDKRGAVGLLELHCPHRGTSLEFGLVGEKGIRCCYHGWLFDVDGTILETPGEPPDSTLKDRLFHGAYPVHEYQGLVFAYMGPPEAQPDFPILDTYELPGYQLAPRQGTVWPCNWLQVKDNSMDPAHLAFLHTLPGSQGFTDDLGALRTTINRPAATTWAVPLDDTHTMQIGFRRAPEGREMRRDGGFGQDGNRPYEERQRVPGDYDAQISIHGGIARHGLEHLAATDRGVIMMRNLIRQGIREVQDGAGPGHNSRNNQPNGKTIATFAHDRVVPGIPAAATPEEDQRLLREIARKVVSDAVRSGGVTA